MASGTITSVDINFSNVSGAEHKVSVEAVEEASAWDFAKAPLPPTAIDSSLDASATFGNPELSALLANFTTTQITTSSGPTGKNLRFDMQDNLSIKLQSIGVLVRGRDIGPKGELDFDGIIYNWSEIPDNVKYTTDYAQYPEAESYGFQTPEWRSAERFLILGQIYNIIELEDTKGEIWTKAYQNQERKFFLELPPKNDVWFINYEWPILNPEEDRGSWQDSRLKLGYTLKEFTEGLDAVGILHENIPLEEEFLIEESGSLYDIMNSTASRLGYYWYIDPVAEKVVWIDSTYIETLAITDYTNTTDTTILNASYTEDVFKESKILSYNTTRQEERREQTQRTQKDRKLLKSFKLLKFNSKIRNVLEYFCGIYYLLWNKGLLSEDYFNKIWFFAMHLSADFRNGIEDIGYTDLLETVMGDTPLNMKAAYNDWIYNKSPDLITRAKQKKKYKLVKEFLKATDVKEKQKSVYRFAFDMAKLDGTTEKSVSLPSDDVYFRILQTYMDAGMGGIYMSGPISNYRKDRIAWEVEDGYRLLGMWRWDTPLDDIEELSTIAEFLRKFSEKALAWDQVQDFAKNLYQDRWNSSWSKDRYYAFVVREPSKKFEKIQDQDIKNLFETGLGSAIVETAATSNRWLLVKTVDGIIDHINQSRDLWPAAKDELDLEEYLSIRYRKLRHPIQSEKHRDEEDNDVPTNNNFDDLDLNREKRKIIVELPAGEPIGDKNPFSLETISAESVQELEAIRRNKAARIPLINRATSSRSIYDLSIPVFSPEISNISINFSSDGIITTITESSLKILPVDQSIIIGRDNLARTNRNPFSSASAKKKNILSL